MNIASLSAIQFSTICLEYFTAWGYGITEVLDFSLTFEHLALLSTVIEPVLLHSDDDCLRLVSEGRYKEGRLEDIRDEITYFLKTAYDTLDTAGSCLSLKYRTNL